MVRTVIVTVALAVAAIATPVAAMPAAGGVPRCWTPPVAAPVVEGFVAPACTWCAGHRGLEFGPTTGVAVRAVADGVVSFAGSVAGLRYVSVDQPDGLRATYGWLASIAVVEGEQVEAAQVVGHAGARLMFTLRRDGSYLDPAPLLGRLVRPPWLVPTGGGPARTPPPARLRCAAGPEGPSTG